MILDDKWILVCITFLGLTILSFSSHPAQMLKIQLSLIELVFFYFLCVIFGFDGCLSSSSLSIRLTKCDLLLYNIKQWSKNNKTS